jgi:transposase
MPALRSFAEGLLIDHDAVAAALALPYSNASTEGVVNKIKTIKGRCTAVPTSISCANASCWPN